MNATNKLAAVKAGTAALALILLYGIGSVSHKALDVGSASGQRTSLTSRIIEESRSAGVSFADAYSRGNELLGKANFVYGDHVVDYLTPALTTSGEHDPIEGSANVSAAK